MAGCLAGKERAIKEIALLWKMAFILSYPHTGVVRSQKKPYGVLVGSPVQHNEHRNVGVLFKSRLKRTQRKKKKKKKNLFKTAMLRRGR